MNHQRWNARQKDTAENIICGIASDGMWFWSLRELGRDTTGIPLADIRATYKSNCTDPYVELIRECRLVCIRELRKRGLSYAKIGEALCMDQALVQRQFKRHIETGGV